ncbi:MAG: hypothetical protein CMM98_02390 [Rickettsiales bacterium]|nr:hypothetical protein [Rickettsiales bacterium]
MKINIIILTLFFFFFSKSNAGQIFIVVKNIEEKVGLIHFALYDDPDFFPENKGKKIGFKKDAKDVIDHGVLIEDLKESYYAIAIFHDKNSNDQFDTFFSIPQERYGFSNNAPVFFGPPSFEEASFFVKNEGMTKIEIDLR